MTIEFLDSNALLYLILIVPILFALIWGNKQAVRRVKSLGRNSATRKHILYDSAVKVILILALILILLRPYWGFEEVVIPSGGRDNLVLIDVSYSMLAKDISPTRLEVAKRKTFDLMSRLKTISTGDRIGIILFAGQSYLYCPLTQDFSTAHEFVRNISSNLITAQGSSINRALETVNTVIERANVKNPRLFIFTDGEDLEFDLPKAVSILDKLEIKPLILGIGKKDGVPIEINSGQYLRDNNGSTVITKLNDDILLPFADTSKGLYKEASLNDSDIQNLLSYDSNLSIEFSPSDNGDTIKVYNEIGSWIALVILILISLSMLLTRRSLIFTFVLVMLLAESSWAIPKSLHDYYKLYNNGQYEEAKNGFEQYWQKNPNDFDLTQSLASSYYKLGDYKKAQFLFNKSLQLGRSGREKFESMYNLGNSYLMDSKFEEAITQYESALRIKEGDQKALHNLELAKKLLEQKQEEDKEEENKEKEDEKNAQENSEENEEKKEQEQNQQNNEEENKEQEQNQQNNNEENENQNKDQDQGQGDDSNEPSEKDSSDTSEESQESNDTSMNDEASSSGETQQTESDQSNEQELSLDQIEALQWLQSLPDAPILIQKKNEQSRSPRGQTW